MNAKKILVGVLIGVDVLAVNAGIGYLFYRSQIQNSNLQITNQISSTGGGTVTDTCGADCQAYIDQRIASLSAARTAGQPAGPSATPKVVYVTQTAPRTKVQSTTYVTVPGSGSTTNNDWTDLPGTEFYFDPADYPGLVSVYFEANMKLFNGNGMAYVRLYDGTNGVGVQGSDVQTNSQADSVVASGQVSFWAGKNLIRVQAKSLTADTAIFSSGRLRIVTEN